MYFDHAATSFPKPPEVIRAVQAAMAECASPGRGGYREAMRAAEVVYICRLKCAALFDCEPEQVIFTSSATHGLNAAIKDLVNAGDRVVISGFEHNAVLRPLAAIGAEITVAGRALFRPEEIVRAFEAALTAETKAAVCTHVSNVFGYVLPLEQIAAICRKRHIPLIVDAAQSAGILPLSLRGLGAAYIAMPGHKGLMGPQGTGILLCGKIPERTLMEGGTGSLSKELHMPQFLPDRMEPGTCNVPGIAGLSAGIDGIERLGIPEIAERERALIRAVSYRLNRSRRVRCFTGADQTGVLSVQVEGEDCVHVAERLAEAGIAVRAGLHCAPLAHESAGTLEQGTVRISVSPFHTLQDAERLTDAMIM